MRLYGFRDGYNGGDDDGFGAARVKNSVSSRLDRAIQYAAASPHTFDVSGILDAPPSRGMTAGVEMSVAQIAWCYASSREWRTYAFSSAVAWSSQAFVVASSAGRTSALTRAW